MKIKILKDIPGYKAGEMIQSPGLLFFAAPADRESLQRHDVILLIKEGFAEEVKDEINMEKIRLNAYIPECGECDELNLEERNFFTAYRIVKAVIEKLNDGWKLDWDKSVSERKYIINYNFRAKEWYIRSTGYHLEDFSPVCKTHDSALKVIELCRPELEILFGVK